jgi:3-oxoacyl-[acyl-carrier-protein] synthase II
MVSPLGGSVDATFDACVEGRSGIRELSRWDTKGMNCRIGGEVDNRWLTEPQDANPAMRPHQLLLTAGRQAAAMAGLSSFPRRERIAVLVGTHGGCPSIEEIAATTRHVGDGTRVDEAGLRAEPGHHDFSFHLRRCDHAPALLAVDLDVRGPVLAVVSACAASAQAIGEATRLLREGRADACVAGGADSQVSFSGLLGFVSARSSNGMPRPRRRRGPSTAAARAS